MNVLKSGLINFILSLSIKFLIVLPLLLYWAYPNAGIWALISPAKYTGIFLCSIFSISPIGMKFLLGGL